MFFWHDRASWIVDKIMLRLAAILLLMQGRISCNFNEELSFSLSQTKEQQFGQDHNGQLHIWIKATRKCMQCSFHRIIEYETWPTRKYTMFILSHNWIWNLTFRPLQLSSFAFFCKTVFGQNVHFTLCSYFFFGKDMSRSNYLTGLSRAQLSLKGDGTMSSSCILQFYRLQFWNFLYLFFRCYFVLLFVNLFNYLTTSRATYRLINRTENKRNRQSERWVKTDILLDFWYGW